MQKLVVDCHTGEQRFVELTPGEEAEILARSKQLEGLEKAEEATRLAKQNKRKSGLLKLLDSVPMTPDEKQELLDFFRVQP